jgi:hypothetical protein
MWNGGRRQNDQGYILLYKPDHPYCDKKGLVREHRIVMEAAIGRYLDPLEVVHHINDDTSDNRVENLRIFSTQAEHKRHEINERSRDKKGKLLPI